MVQQHGEEQAIPKEHRVTRPGAWLPADRRVHKEWLRKQVDKVSRNPSKGLSPALKELRTLIDTTPRLRMLFSQMWDEVPKAGHFIKDPAGNRAIKDTGHLLAVWNHILTRAPEWTEVAEGAGFVGVPMCAVLDYAIGTPSGHAAFLDPEVNKILKKVLNEWGEFLKSPASAHVLGRGKGQWFGEIALRDLMAVANGPLNTSYKFEEFFICDGTKEDFGFTSWDDFFTRQLHPGVRPVPSPPDTFIIANACESKTFNLVRGARLKDSFWIKGQPYSVGDMLAWDPLHKHFDHSTVYQAFLSALSYHRWHSPVSGTIKRAFVQDGTYFSAPLFEDGESMKYSIAADGLDEGQGYLTSMATRAVMFIEADSADIGLMAIVAVGMDEVSTCHITVKEGQHVEKGEELGMFHFGGSSHCLLFREGVEVHGFPLPGRKENVPVGAKLAVVTPAAAKPAESK